MIPKFLKKIISKSDRQQKKLNNKYLGSLVKKYKFKVEKPIGKLFYKDFDLALIYGYLPTYQIYIKKINGSDEFPHWMIERRIVVHEYFRFFWEKFDKKNFIFMIQLFLEDGKIELKELDLKTGGLR